jgi:hypothetical protein
MGKVLVHMPATASGHLALAEPGAIHSFFAGWVREMVNAGRLEGVQIRERPRCATSLASALELLDPLVDHHPPTRIVVLSTRRDGWSAVWTNGADCAAWSGAAGRMTSDLNTQAVYYRRIPHTLVPARAGKPTGVGGMVTFKITRNGKKERLVELGFDAGRWVFTEQGTPLPFEQTSRYRLPRKAERFDGELLVEYLGALGLRPFDDDFFQVNRDRPADCVELELESRRGMPKVESAPLATLRRRWRLDDST